ncbi:MAG TPA: fatty acid desaturase, partial [Bacteroidales bacterium]|nr:fatty acid desaturase [Bacteroidales bacterium]
MSTTHIKFANKRQTEFVIDLRKQVNDYFKANQISKNGNITMVLKTIFMFSLYLIPYFMMITGVVTRPPLLLGMYMLMSLGMAGIGLSVMHDANHRAYSSNQTVNRILSMSLSLVGGFAPLWRHQHNTMHHGFTNIEGYDEDINPVSILRFSPGKPLYKIHRFQQFYAWFFYGLMTITWSIDKDFKQIFRYRREGIELSQNKSFSRLFTELILSKLFYYTYILVIPILVLPIPWWMVVLFYIVMHLGSGFILGIIFQTAHVMPSSEYPEPDESGTMENNWAIHQLLTTSDYAPKS